MTVELNDLIVAVALDFTDPFSLNDLVRKCGCSAYAASKVINRFLDSGDLQRHKTASGKFTYQWVN